VLGSWLKHRSVYEYLKIMGVILFDIIAGTIFCRAGGTGFGSGFRGCERRHSMVCGRITHSARPRIAKSLAKTKGQAG